MRVSEAATGASLLPAGFLAVATALILRGFPAAAELVRFGVYCLLPAPFLAPVGILLADAAYLRYRSAGQRTWQVIAGLCIGFGWAIMVVGCCGLSLAISVLRH